MSLTSADMTVFAYGEFPFMLLCRHFGGTGRLDSTILANEIDNDTPDAGRTIFHLHKRAGGARVIGFAG